jgi:hypothetical protein
MFEELVVFVTINRSKSPNGREKIVELVTSALPGLVSSRCLCIKMYVRLGIVRLLCSMLMSTLPYRTQDPIPEFGWVGIEVAETIHPGSQSRGSVTP